MAREALWAALDEPARLARALPHVDDFVPDGEGAFTATIRPATSLGEVPFATRWRRRARRAPEALGYEVHGRHQEYLLELAVDLELRDEGEDVTRVAWAVEAGFTGAMRAVGQRVLPAIVTHQVGLVLDAAAAGSP